MNAYSHTQRAPLGYLMGLIALAFTASALLVPDPVVNVAHAGVAVLVLFFAFCFGHMTVSDEGEHLAVRYGPLPVFRKRIRYADITEVERGRSSIIDGWGIHWIPWRGTTYNLWGFDCAELVVKGRKLRIGSDDADALVSFLRGRMSQDGAREALNPT